MIQTDRKFNIFTKNMSKSEEIQTNIVGNLKTEKDIMR
jgi:hypothetical protein